MAKKKIMVCQNKIYSAKVFKYNSRVIPLQILYMSGGDVNFFMMLRRTNHYTLPPHKWQKKIMVCQNKIYSAKRFKYTSRVIPLQILYMSGGDVNFFMMLRRTNHYTLPPHKWQKLMMVCQNKIYSVRVFKYNSRVIPLQILNMSGGDVNFFRLLRRTNHYTLPPHKWQKKWWSVRIKFTLQKYSSTPAGWSLCKYCICPAVM